MKWQVTRVARKLALATVLMLAATPALARPGTPANESATSPRAGQLTLRWQNTAGEDGIVFDIEGQSDPSVANWAPPGGVRVGTIVSYTFNNLGPGWHCFRIWSRVGVQGLRSEQPSAETCANVISTRANPPNDPHRHY